MDLSSLSEAALNQNDRSCPAPHGPAPSTESADELLQQLHVQRMELEMQSRALHEAELEIESASHRYSDLYDHLPIGYVTVTPKGRIVQANLTAAEWLRRDRSQLVGIYFSWFLDAFDAGRFASHLESCVQAGNAQALDVTLRLESGLLLSVQLTSRIGLHGSDGEPEVHTAITNITKLKQVNGLSHDLDAEQPGGALSSSESLRAPLRTLGSFARGMLRDYGAELSVDAKNTIERMECAAVRTEATVHHLLEYCGLGHEEVALDPVSLEELMQHVIMEHRFLLARHGAELVVDRPLPCVRGARLLLGHVLASIIVHAVHNTTPGDQLRLRVAATQEQREVVLTVSDECRHRNLPPAEKRFRVFERLHEQDGFYGAAVGLAVLRQAIERMHGRVWMESDAGKVTRLKISLPAV
jgi:signal transduction histidine kinase